MIENVMIIVVVSLLLVVMSADGDGDGVDGLLREYGLGAFDVVLRPKTGVAYDGVVPCNLTGIRVSAMRLKTGSLLSRGVSMYREFEIPKGVVIHPYVERLALVYHNLANFSTFYYPPLHGYTYLAPVLGLFAYQYMSNLYYQDQDHDHYEVVANNLPPPPPPPPPPPRLYMRASLQPISIHFDNLLLLMPNRRLSPDAKCKCVFFHVNGSLTLADMWPDYICTTFEEGHFSLVVESESISVSTVPEKKRSSKNTIVGVVMGGFTLLVVLGMGVAKYKLSKKKMKTRMKMKMHSMETAAEVGEALHMTAVGATKAPVAIWTRTLPKLETDYVP